MDLFAGLLAQANTAPLQALDFAVICLVMIGVIVYGAYMGRKEEGTRDYFLAGRSVAWWAVAGSIFGTNISSHHLVGMMGAGLRQGFAQANFEYGAIFGLMLLCYFFLPLYRRMGLYTLSEYLGRRFDDRSRLLYSLTNMAFLLIQLCGTLILGAVTVEALTTGTDFAVSYHAAVVGFAVVAAAYTAFGGLKAVIYTDVVQSVLLLFGAGMIAVLAIYHPSVGGVSGLLERQPEKFHVFFASDHPDLPWTGVLSGLMLLHFYYWSTNQFMVQRALGARTGWDGRMGIITAGFFKLLIPFICIVPGMAAAFILDIDAETQSDTAFAGLTRALVPAGYGLVGLVMTGLIAGVLSTIDSMMNSTATLFTFDVYQKYIDPRASERRLIGVGRISMTLMVAVGVAVSLALTQKQRETNVFLTMADYNAYLVPGIIIAFLAGILSPRVTRTAAFACILVGPIASIAIDRIAAWRSALNGEEGSIQAFHRTALAALVCVATLIVASFLSQRERSDEREQYTWRRYHNDPDEAPASSRSRWLDDRLWAALLVGLTLWLCWYFA